MGENRMRLYVKKINSLNPTEYKYVEVDKAMIEHQRYVANIVHNKNEYVKGEPKLFDVWLRTEI